MANEVVVARLLCRHTADGTRYFQSPLLDTDTTGVSSRVLAERERQQLAPHVTDPGTLTRVARTVRTATSPRRVDPELPLE